MKSIRTGHITHACTMHDVEADIHYFRDAEDGRAATIEDIASNNTSYMDTRKVLIRDIRDQVHRFTLDQHGFMYVNHELTRDHVQNEDTIRSKHYPEMENFILNLYVPYINEPQCDRVY